MLKKIIVSGIQPTGNLHVGNYLGAVKNWVELQNSNQYEMFIFIADLHSLTGEMSAKERHEQILITAVELISAGIDPKKTTLWVQSHVPTCTELAWIFGSVTPVSELLRMTQFKEKSNLQKNNINTGLFTYPILQAADILLYRGTHVPVGEDQKQHIELTRDIARWYNKKYGKLFLEPQSILTKTPRIKSLLDPEKKMSKSLGFGHVLELADEPKIIESKLKKAVTATIGGGKAPGVQNLLTLLQHFGDPSVHKKFITAEKKGDIRYGDLKNEVGNSISDYFIDFREKRKNLLANHDEIAEILIDGSDKATEIAEDTMKHVMENIGL